MIEEEMSGVHILLKFFFPRFLVVLLLLAATVLSRLDFVFAEVDTLP